MFWSDIINANNNNNKTISTAHTKTTTTTTATTKDTGYNEWNQVSTVNKPQRKTITDSKCEYFIGEILIGNVPSNFYLSQSVSQGIECDVDPRTQVIATLQPKYNLIHIIVSEMRSYHFSSVRELY